MRSNEEIVEMQALTKESKELVEAVRQLDECIRMWQSDSRLPHPQDSFQERRVVSSSA